MATYPKNRAEFLTWAEAHVDVFSANAAAIGLTAAQATAFKNQVGALRGRTTAQEAARLAAKAATEAVVDADSDTRELTSDLVRSIRAFATNNNNPNVYVLAQIPAPSTGQPVPPPGQPTDFKVELNSDGSITLKWKAKHPEGSDRVVYFVQRKLISETAFRLIGGSGEKSYQDDTLPIGIDGATYIITAQRGNVQGQPSRQLTVTFGSGGPGANGGEAWVCRGRCAGEEGGVIAGRDSSHAIQGLGGRPRTPMKNKTAPERSGAVLVASDFSPVLNGQRTWLAEGISDSASGTFTSTRIFGPRSVSSVDT